MTLNEPAELRRIALGLWAAREGGAPLEPAVFGALVEATFRLAVHPSTPAGEALILLRRARRLDPADPRHVYHLGLLLLRHRRLPEAAAELREAGRLAPTSHRIWAHLAILQRRLDEERVGTAGYAGEFRRRAERITTAIRDGVDDPDPGPDGPEPNPHLGVTAVRIGRAGRCRWTGVRDLDVEERLLGTASERSRDRLLTELTELARLTPRRRGGTGAFAVLGVQWLLRGYPAATLRALAEPLRADDPGFVLLDAVLGVHELPEAEVPAALARHQRAGTLPEFLILLLYRALLLRRPLEFPDLGAYRAAQELVAEEGEPDPGAAERCAAALMTAVRRLDPAPVQRVTDAVVARAALGAGESLARLEEATERFRTQDDAAFTLAKRARAAVRTADGAARVRLAADVAALEEVTGALKPLVAALLAEWDAVGDLPSEDLQRRYGAVKQKLQNTRHGQARKQLKAARTALGETTGDGPPSAGVAALRDALLPGTADRPPARPARPEPSGTGRELVASALAIADATMGEVFTQAHAALDGMPPGEARHLLVREVRGREAEAAYRLGHTAHARRLWSRMLGDDPYDPVVLHNLAAAQTVAGDLPAAAEGWQAYLTALYARDLAAGDPRGHAAERARVHGVLAGAFGTLALTVPAENHDAEEKRAPEVTAILAGSGRMAAYERHLRLEILNRRLAGSGARLRLGVAPDAPEETLAAARDRAVAEARAACEHLPRRIAGPFAELCAATLTAPGRPGTAEADGAGHAALVDRLLRQKQRLRGLLSQDRTWCLSVYSGDVIAGLRRIDGMPLDGDDDATVAAVQQFRGNRDPATLVAELNQLAGVACRVALDQVFTEAEGDDPQFPGRYRATGESWVRAAVPERYLGILDAPGFAQPQIVREAMTLAGHADGELTGTAREVVEGAVRTLDGWTARLRGASGPPADQAELLCALGLHTEAYRVLDAAATVVFAPGGRIERARITVDLGTGRFASAVARTRTLLAGDTEDAGKRLLGRVYLRWITAGGPGPDPAEIARDFGSWTDPESVRERRLLVVRATLKRLEGAPGATVEEAMRGLVRDDPGNRDAAFHLVLDGLYRELEEIRLRERNSAGPARRRIFEERTTLLDLCRTCCRAYLAEPDDPDDPLAENRRKVLSDFLQQLGG
ncbi:hypothetical protein [Actinoplanes sp. NPDC051851]|uniref:hypothetical protein n=1 Tax=Actinoplanes sp. NPDC051851 TaxID=3154753 RepID=UPI0034182758